jgi:hypothetical protein
MCGEESGLSAIARGHAYEYRFFGRMDIFLKAASE